MLLRIACEPCGLRCLWTDEPGCFLATICGRPGRCRAVLRDEPFGREEPPPAEADRDPVPTAAAAVAS